MDEYSDTKAETPESAPESAEMNQSAAESDGEDKRDSIRERVIEKLQDVYDPEIPVNIYELGLIYSIDVDSSGKVRIEMTLTSPACPVAGSLPGEVEARAQEAEGVTSAEVEVVWDPPWNMEMMSESAKLELGFM